MIPKVAFPTGIEPVTYALEERCSIQLSYGNKMWGRRDSNPQPIGYEPTALTIELHPQKWCKIWESNPCSALVAGHHDYKSCGASNYTNLAKFGIEGGTRTLTPSLATDFKSVVSAIPPLRHIFKISISDFFIWIIGNLVRPICI
jgi:hypothetical protein